MTESVPIEAIAAVEFNKFVDRIFGSVAFALLYYDFFLTLSREIELYWKNTISWPYFLFFLNRYMSVITHIPVIIEFFGDLPAPRCRQIQQYHRVATVVIQAVVVALLTLRTYALYGCNHRILALLLAIIGAAGAVCIWAITVGRGPSATAPTPYTGVQVASRPGCDLTLSQQQGYDTALAWGSVLVFEATVFILTLLQALKVGRAWRGGYIRVMLRDGTIYFGVLLVFYLTTILTLALGNPAYRGITTSLTNVVSSVLITRLMLNIRDPNLREQPRRLCLTSSEDIYVY